MSSLLLMSALTGVVPTVPCAGEACFGYEGFLTDQQDVPLTGPVDIVLKLYDGETATAPLWAEEHVGVPVLGGVFALVVGSEMPLASADLEAPVLWLGLTIDADSEMAPRQPLLSVPRALVAERAMHAESASVLAGYGADAFVRSVNGVAPVAGNIVLQAGDNVSIAQDSGAITISAASAADTRCDDAAAGCAAVTLNAAHNGANVLGTSPQAAAADALFWGNQQVALGPHTTSLAWSAVSGQPYVVSRIDGVTNDEGNIDLVAGAGISIASDDATNTITIAATIVDKDTDTRCDTDTCAQLKLNDGLNPDNVLNTVPGQGAADTLYWGDQPVALGPHTSSLPWSAITNQPTVLSSLNGLTNDEGNVDLVAGANVSIAPDAANHSVTISSADTRCDTATCGRVRLNDTTNTNNVLGTSPSVGAADALYWGDKLLLGQNYELAESVDVATATYAAWNDKLQLVVTGAPTGTYRVGWSYGWSHSLTYQDFEAQIVDGDSDVHMQHREEPKEVTSQGMKQRASGFFFVTFSGDQTFSLRFRANSAGTATMSDARMEFYRVR